MKALGKRETTHFIVSLLVILSVFFVVGAVFASSGGGHGESSFDKTKDLIYRTMNFVVLAGGLVFLLRKPMAKGLESRRQGIREQLAGLEKQKQEAEQQLKEYQGKLARLDQEIQGIVAEYVKQGEAAKAKIIEEAKAAAEKLQEQAKKNIEHEFETARQQLRVELAEQTITMAETLIKKNIKNEDQERIIGEYLTKVVVAQ